MLSGAPATDKDSTDQKTAAPTTTATAAPTATATAASASAAGPTKDPVFQDLGCGYDEVAATVANVGRLSPKTGVSDPVLDLTKLTATQRNHHVLPATGTVEKSGISSSLHEHKIDSDASAGWGGVVGMMFNLKYHDLQRHTLCEFSEPGFKLVDVHAIPLTSGFTTARGQLNAAAKAATDASDAAAKQPTEANKNAAVKAQRLFDDQINAFIETFGYAVVTSYDRRAWCMSETTVVTTTVGGSVVGGASSGVGVTAGVTAQATSETKWFVQVPTISGVMTLDDWKTKANWKTTHPNADATVINALRQPITTNSVPIYQFLEEGKAKEAVKSRCDERAFVPSLLKGFYNWALTKKTNHDKSWFNGLMNNPNTARFLHVGRKYDGNGKPSMRVFVVFKHVFHPQVWWINGDRTGDHTKSWTYEKSSDEVRAVMTKQGYEESIYYDFNPWTSDDLYT